MQNRWFVRPVLQTVDQVTQIRMPHTMLNAKILAYVFIGPDTGPEAIAWRLSRDFNLR
jgi:hypothetical protein